jgi:hypothetical protein
MRALALVLLLASPAMAQDGKPGLQLRGDARMGLTYTPRNPALGGVQDGLRLSSRARLHFQFMGETDGGTRYGVNFDVDGTNKPKGTSVFIGQ